MNERDVNQPGTLEPYEPPESPLRDHQGTANLLQDLDALLTPYSEILADLSEFDTACPAA
jgi:hypothetical protein